MSSSLLDTDLTFVSLSDKVGLDVRLKKGVASLGLERPTLVQSKCLPLAINEGRDLLVRARTGSGKTLAYCLPLLHKILAGQQQAEQSEGFVRALILVPTRELCNQVVKVIKYLSYFCSEDISVALLPGIITSSGVGSNDKNNKKKNKKKQEELARQEAMLRDRPNIIVATPAGLLAHIRSGTLDSLKTSVETLVVDEADLVLSFGYANDIAEIMKSLPKICQGFLMSATLSPELNSLKKICLHSPAILKLEEDDAPLTKKDGKLTQFYLRIPRKDNYLVLYVFLKLGLLKGKGLFFCNTTDAGYRLKLFLEQFHIRSAVLNAELPFKSRINIQEQFNVGNFDYLIATDESTDVGGPREDDEDDDNDDDSNKKQQKKKSKRKKDSEYGVSRGLDFRNVSFVVNVDFPPTPQSYTHRVGRTARGGAKGVALSLVNAESAEHDELLQRVQNEQPPLVSSATSNHLMQTAAPTHGDNDGGAQMMTGNNQYDQQQQEAQQLQQPSPLDFDLKEIEGFRYRVEDVSRAVTKTAVRETRAAELRAEILNSDRLQSHFDDNPADLQILRHDRLATHVSKVQEHLKHIPKYMLPRGMHVADLHKKRKRKRIRNNRQGGNAAMMGQRRTDNDPLQSYDGDADVNLDGVAGEEEDGEYAEFFNDDNNGDNNKNNDDSSGSNKRQKKEQINVNKIFANTSDGTGKSTSGRKQWKEKHKRSGKTHNKKSQRKYDTLKSQKGF